MKTVNVHDAKTQLSRLLERAHAGEEIIIAKAESHTRGWCRSTFERRSDRPERSKSSLRSRMISSSLFQQAGLGRIDGEQWMRRSFFSTLTH
jgi:hypothetical protein